MDDERDPIGVVLRDLALLGQAVRSARLRAARGSDPARQLALALWAGEHAQTVLIDLLQPLRGDEG